MIMLELQRRFQPDRGARTREMAERDDLRRGATLCRRGIVVVARALPRIACMTSERKTKEEEEELRREVELEGSGPAPDVGPNAEISRESPSGKPGDTTKTRDVPFPGGAP